MQISQLAEQSGVPLATVKFYLREGLVPPGRRVAATRSDYDDSHVRRLRLLRSLTEVAGLTLSTVREVLAAADNPAESLGDALDTAQAALPPVVPEDTDTTDAQAVIAELGWNIDPGCVALRQLASAMTSLTIAEADVSPATLAEYGRAVHPLAVREVAAIPTTSQQDAVRYVVLGTLFYEPVLLALRRLAQQDATTPASPVRRTTRDP